MRAARRTSWALFVLGMICIGPVVGMLTSRYPARRSWMLLAVIASH
jgi:hypothetical protein